MSLPTIDPRPAEKLGSLVDQYLNAGGTIETLPGPSLAPLPPRRHPKAHPKTSRKPLMEAHVARYRMHGPAVIAMRKRGVLLKDIAKNIGMSASFVSNCLAYFGVADEESDKAARELKEMVQKIRIMAADGHSARYIAEQLGVTASRVLYHAGKNDVVFRKG